MQEIENGSDQLFRFIESGGGQRGRKINSKDINFVWIIVMFYCPLSVNVLLNEKCIEWSKIKEL